LGNPKRTPAIDRESTPLHTGGVTGSIPVAPTSKMQENQTYPDCHSVLL
jgi:hypothetical protein